MINRFKEMIDAGVAKAKYDDRFSCVNNNMNYHTLNDICRLYNSVWGYITGTNMRYDENSGEYFIFGSNVRTENFKKMMSRTWFDTTYFHNSFKCYDDIYTMIDFFRHFNLCYEYKIFNGETILHLTLGYDEICNQFKEYEIGDMEISGDTTYSILGCPISVFRENLNVTHKGMKMYSMTLEKFLDKNHLSINESESNENVVVLNNIEKMISNLQEKLKSYNFEDNIFNDFEGETRITKRTMENLSKYYIENENLINETIKSIIENRDFSGKFKNDMVGKLLFPFTYNVCNESKSNVYGVCEFDLKNGLNLSFLNKKKYTFNENFVREVSDKLEFCVCE